MTQNKVVALTCRPRNRLGIEWHGIVLDTR